MSNAYADRKIDLWAFQESPPGSDILPQSLLIPVPGYICTGIEKLVQRWLIEFNTITGSVLFQPLRGSTFISAMRQGRIQTEADIIAEFGFAAMTIYNTIKRGTADSAPADEQLVRADLEAFSVLDDQIQLRIKITSRAQDTRTVIVPVPFSIISTN